MACHACSQRRGGHTTNPEHMPASHRAHLEWAPQRLIACDGCWAGIVDAKAPQVAADSGNRYAERNWPSLYQVNTPPLTAATALLWSREYSSTKRARLRLNFAVARPHFWASGAGHS